MGKDKKKTLGIKTTRYFTKNCTNCMFEYPNWFTNCPKCGAAWDAAKAAEALSQKGIQKKTIKIVVKITEDDFNNTLERVQLIFSADRGKSWYRLQMEHELDYFIAEIADVPMGSIIIYYIEVLLAHGEVIIENNDGNYFYYEVGIPIEESEGDRQFLQQAALKSEYNELPEMTKPNRKLKEIISEPLVPPSQIYINDKDIQPPQQPKRYRAEDNVTIFGKLQTQIDPDLKICPYCNSKIKKLWSTCPICGKNL
ncbi:MAG: zinc ribbon domain-containing protein [Promethearchaeota archaeon]